MKVWLYQTPDFPNMVDYELNYVACILKRESRVVGSSHGSTLQNGILKTTEGFQINHFVSEPYLDLNPARKVNNTRVKEVTIKLSGGVSRDYVLQYTTQKISRICPYWRLRGKCKRVKIKTYFSHLMISIYLFYGKNRNFSRCTY